MPSSILEHPSSSFQALGDHVYRSIQLCRTPIGLKSGNDLLRRRIFAAPLGGAVAIYEQAFTWDDVVSKIMVYSSINKSEPDSIIKIKSAVAGIGWSADEKLLIVHSDGKVRCYPEIHGDYEIYNIWKEGENHEINSCEFYSTGFVAQVGQNKFVHVADYQKFDAVWLSQSPVIPQKWAIVPPIPGERYLAVLLISESRLLRLTQIEQVECSVKQDSLRDFRDISVSPCGQYVALLTAQRKVIRMSSHLDSNGVYYESELDDPELPVGIKWCGSSSPVVFWKERLAVVGQGVSSLGYDYASTIQLAPGVDGLRVFSFEVCELIQRTPADHESVFNTISSGPGSKLLRSFLELHTAPHRSHEGLQQIQTRLPSAVEECTRAAGHEFEPGWQKKALSAASFGKSVLNFYDSDLFVETVNTIRVLNAIRAPDIGLYITIEEYNTLGPKRVIERLRSRRHYALALRIAEHLKLPTDQIYFHWALQKIRGPRQADETMYTEIMERLKGKKGVPYVDIATIALSNKLRGIAEKLLDMEPRVSERVQLLLKMGEDELALEFALDSSITDLIYRVIFHMYERTVLAKSEERTRAFLKTISKYATAYSLFSRWAKLNDPKLLPKLKVINDDNAEMMIASSLDYEPGSNQWNRAIGEAESHLKIAPLRDALSKWKAEHKAELRARERSLR